MKGAAKNLLERIADKLVLDWKRRQQSRSAVRVEVGKVLDAELPDVYGPELFDRKVDAIFDHIYTSYFDNGRSVYDAPEVITDTGPPVTTLPITVEEVSDDLLVRARTNPELSTKLMKTVFGPSVTWTCPTRNSSSTTRRGPSSTHRPPDQIHEKYARTTQRSITSSKPLPAC